MNMIFYLLMIPLWASTFALTITDLTGIGASINTKPFNCFVCLAWWVGVGSAVAITWGMLPWTMMVPVAIGSGGMSVVYAYFIKKQIWKR